MERFLLFLFTFAFVAIAQAQQRGVINDPDGYVNLRAGKSVDAAVITKVKTGERFAFEAADDSDWCKVKLASGKSGWMHLSRVRLHFTEKDLPSEESDPAGPSEIDEVGLRRGFNYARDTQRAARGDTAALKKFFEVAQDADGAAAESIYGVPTVVFHLLGDEKFASFLEAQPLPYRMMVRNRILGDGLIPPAGVYLSRHFPETTKVLLQREMIDWVSPNGLYAIRKVFTDELELGGSKVKRAELIEKKTGRVLCDLTPDDIGTGAQREGEALWSPDSKRVACLSSDLTVSPGNLFSTPRPPPQRKQTAVYQASGDSFTRVALALSDVPGRAEDAELKDAILGHEFTEPLRWAESNVLILQRHEYYETLKPEVVGGETFNTIHPLSRMYEITVTFVPDGHPTAVWKRIGDD